MIMAQKTIFCSRCGESILADSTFCQRCGAAVLRGVPAGTAAPSILLMSQPYGGFWIRVLAYFVDRLITGILFSPVAILLSLRLYERTRGMARKKPEQLAPFINFALP